MKKIGLILAVILVLGLSALNLKDMFSGIGKLPGGEKAKVVLDTMSGYDTAYAAVSSDITITVTCRYLSLTVAPSTWTIGVIDPGYVSYSSVTPGAIVVTNNGNATETFGLMVQNDGDDWTLDTTPPPGTDEVSLWGLFQTTAPIVDGDFINGTGATGDSITLTPNVPATTTRFSNAAGNGVAVPNTEARNLWLKLQAPADQAASRPLQTIVVRVTATSPI